MFCPSCGAQNNEPDQRYCQECGTSLPSPAGKGTAIAHRPGAELPTFAMRGGPQSSTTLRGGAQSATVIPHTLRNKLLLGAGATVLAAIVLYVVVTLIVDALHVLIPVIVLGVIGYGGFLYLRHSKSH